jgi:hypothetical protein
MVCCVCPHAWLKRGHPLGATLCDRMWCCVFGCTAVLVPTVYVRQCCVVEAAIGCLYMPPVACVQVLVEHGTEVRTGDDLLIIEAMKVSAWGTV